MNFLYQSDDNYAPYMGVSIYSLLKNNNNIKDICIYIIDDGISDFNRKKIQSDVDKFGRTCIFIDSNLILEDVKMRKYPSYGGTRKNVHSFLKLFLGSILPEDVNRIVYIDCDTLVLGDVSELECLDMDDCIIGMAQDCLIVEKKAMIGLNLEERYYNSGVMLFDLEKWRIEDCERKLIEHAHDHVYGTVDQDMINVVFRNRIKCLDIKYNFQPQHLVYDNKTYFKVFKHSKGTYYCDEEINYARNHIIIMHFFRYIGEQPWHKDNVHPCTQYFDAYIAQSAFKDYVKLPANKSLFFEIEKFIYKVIPHRWFLSLFKWFFEIKLKIDAKNA